MHQRMRYYPEIVSTLVAEDHVMKALDYAIQFEVSGVRLRSLLENAEQAKQKGEDIKASMIVRRIADLRKVSLRIVTKFRLTSKNWSQVPVTSHFWLNDQAHRKDQFINLTQL